MCLFKGFVAATLRFAREHSATLVPFNPYLDLDYSGYHIQTLSNNCKCFRSFSTSWIKFVFQFGALHINLFSLASIARMWLFALLAWLHVFMPMQM